MKKILFAVVLLLSFAGYAQETSYELIDENTVEVTVKSNGRITQRGEMVNVKGILRPEGIWREYDKDNKVTLRVMYSEGKRLWVEKDLGAYVVSNRRKGSI
jgi:antitoxin component YwqK of YwqJK toxin-antitoxin module